MSDARDVDLFGNEIVAPVSLDRELLERGIVDYFSTLEAADIASLLCTPLDAMIEFARLCRGDRAGQKLSLVFNPHRLDTATEKSCSIVEAFHNNTNNFARGIARVIALNDGKVNDLLYQAFGMGVQGIQYVNEFPPAVARDVYVNFNATSVLDPCAGWGGRMIGAAACDVSYFAFEPATQTYDGLLRLGDWLQTLRPSFHFEVVNAPFEDAGDLGEDVFDLALTSPPYWNTEHYSDEATQARMRYKSWEEFADKFLLPMARNAVRACKRGFVINVGSRRYPMRASLKDEFGDAMTEVDWVGLGRSGGIRNAENDGEAFFHITKGANCGS